MCERKRVCELQIGVGSNTNTQSFGGRRHNEKCKLPNSLFAANSRTTDNMKRMGKISTFASLAVLPLSIQVGLMDNDYLLKMQWKKFYYPEY